MTTQPKTYFIKYQCLNSNGVVIKEGKTKAKGMYSEFEAQAKFDEYCKKTVPGHAKLVVIKITIDTIIGEMPSKADQMGDMIDAFFKGFKS